MISDKTKPEIVIRNGRIKAQWMKHSPWKLKLRGGCRLAEGIAKAPEGSKSPRTGNSHPKREDQSAMDETPPWKLKLRGGYRLAEGIAKAPEI
jgi:hypothetical protein